MHAELVVMAAAAVRAVVAVLTYVDRRRHRRDRPVD